MKKNDFEFSYSAPTSAEREEIESIKSQYAPKSQKQEKLDRLRFLDNKVKQTPMILSLVCGVVGILLFGLGITMVLEWKLWIWGVLIGGVGFVPMVMAYPIYVHALRHGKNKHREEILKLSEELLNEDEKTAN